MRLGNAAGWLFGIACLLSCGGRVLGGDGASAGSAPDSSLPTQDSGGRPPNEDDACSGDCGAGETDHDGSRAPVAEAAADEPPCVDAAIVGPPPLGSAAAPPWPPPPQGPVPCISSMPTPGISCCGFLCCTGVCQDAPGGAFCCNPPGTKCGGDAYMLCCPGLSCTSGVCG
jgi:hypothetical protein